MKEKYIGIIEIDDDVITIVKRGNVLIGGGATNCGLVESYKMEIDECFSLDENLQQFIEQVEKEIE